MTGNIGRTASTRIEVLGDENFTNFILTIAENVKYSFITTKLIPRPYFLHLLLLLHKTVKVMQMCRLRIKLYLAKSFWRNVLSRAITETVLSLSQWYCIHSCIDAERSPHNLVKMWLCWRGFANREFSHTFCATLNTFAIRQYLLFCGGSFNADYAWTFILISSYMTQPALIDKFLRLFFANLNETYVWKIIFSVGHNRHGGLKQLTTCLPVILFDQCCNTRFLEIDSLPSRTGLFYWSWCANDMHAVVYSKSLQRWRKTNWTLITLPAPHGYQRNLEDPFWGKPKWHGILISRREAGWRGRNRNMCLFTIFLTNWVIRNSEEIPQPIKRAFRADCVNSRFEFCFTALEKRR